MMRLLLRKLYKYILIGLCLTLLYSCRIHRELHKDKNKDKTLLNSTSVKVNKYKGGDNLYHPSPYLIEDYIKQKANRRFLINRWKPYTGLYLRSEDNFNTKRYKERIQKKITRTKTKFEKRLEKHKENEIKVEQLKNKKTKKLNELIKRDTVGTSLMMSLKQPPAWLNDSLTKLSIEQISLLLQSKGYFNSTVTTSKKEKRGGRAIDLTYKIEENRPHLLDKINFTIEDTTIRRILSESGSETLLKKNNNFDVETISAERERIYNLLRNQGYFDFHRQYINFKIDTLIRPYKANIGVQISNPAGSSNHTQYRVSKIKVYIDKGETTLTDTITYDEIVYYHNNEKYSKKVLGSKIALKNNDLYSINKAQYTRNNIGNLPIVKFINLSFIKIDSTNLTAIITIKTHKKYQISSELGANLNVSQGQSIPGPYINANLKNRKLLKGFESLEFNANYTIQGQLSLTEPDSIYRAREIGGNIALTFPRLMIPNALRQLNLVKGNNSAKYDTYKSTSLEVGYASVSRQEYNRSNLSLDFIYKWQKGEFSNLYFSPLSLNIVRTPFQTVEFAQLLKDQSTKSGINLEASFRESIISNFNAGFLWSDVDLTKNKKSTLFKATGEIGGLTGTLISKLTGKDEIFNLPFYQYYKLSTDFRKYYPTSKYSNLVFRVSGGYERPIINSDVLPFEKYFFTGGVSSNRAWRARRIGPGTYNPTDVQDESFQRPGEILLESNIEYRTRISGIFHTAFFLDASNVWTNEEDENRPGSKFDAKTVYKSIALGGGMGIRLDFSLLIFRLDLGYQIYDPAVQSFKKFEPLNPLYNFGIGYPF